MKRITVFIGIFLTLFTPNFLVAQDSISKRIGIDELFRLAIENSQQLKVSRLNVDIAKKHTEVVKTSRNPTLSASASAFYLGDVSIFDNKLKNRVTVAMPHFGNSFAVQANQVVFKGGAISNNIAIASLEEQVVVLGFQRTNMDVKLLMAANYFDLFRMYNQREVYQRNIKLAELRINNLNKMYKLGMLTRNDIIRNELLITNLSTEVQQLDNNIAILCLQLSVTLGLPENTIILPDTSILENKPLADNLSASLDIAFQNHPDLQSARIGTQVAEKNVAVAKSDKLPMISLTAANSLSRPVTNISPSVDMYSNGWQAGVSVSYNISSLYNSTKNVGLAKIQLKQRQQTIELERQTIEIKVKSAFIKHQAAKDLLLRAQKSLQLAEDNFRIVEKKYLNQMAIFTDLLDATNARLEAQLNLNNTEINIVYTYYQLQREIGTL